MVCTSERGRGSAAKPRKQALLREKVHPQAGARAGKREQEAPTFLAARAEPRLTGWPAGVWARGGSRSSPPPPLPRALSPTFRCALGTRPCDRRSTACRSHAARHRDTPLVCGGPWGMGNGSKVCWVVPSPLDWASTPIEPDEIPPPA